MRFWCCWLMLLMCSETLAATCAAVFPDPAASHGPGSSIRFQPNARLAGGDGFIDFSSMTDNAGGFSCSTANCQLSGSYAASTVLPTFEAANSTQRVFVPFNQADSFAAGNYDEVVLETNAIATATTSGGTYRIRRMHLGGSSRITLAGGTYWIDQLTTDNNAIISVASGQKVTIYINTQMQLGVNVQVNAHGDASDLVIMSHQGVQVGQYNYVKAFIYAEGQVEYATQAQHFGAVNAQQVVLQDYAQVRYEPTSLATIDSPGLCSDGPTLPDPIGHWPIDVCALSGSSGEVVDVEGNNNGRSIGGPSIDNNGYYCQAAYFRGQGDHLSIPHSNAYLLSEGAISFWFNTDNLAYFYRASAGGMTLWSKDSAGLDNGGHLTISLTSSGGIKVQHANANFSAQITTSSVVTEGQWHHLVYTFGPSGMLLYLDNQVVGSNASFTDGLISNGEPIIIAGNAWQTSDNQSPSFQLTDFYQGKLDDLKIFDEQLNSDQVALLNGEVEGNCSTCTSNPVLLSHWPMDVCSVTGTSGEIVDTVSGYNGTAYFGVGQVNNGRFCQGLSMPGEGQFVVVGHANPMQLNEGTVAFWFKVSDLNHRYATQDQLQVMWSKDAIGYGQGDHLSIGVDVFGRIRFYHEGIDANSSVTLLTNSVVNERDWHHVAYSWNSSRVDVHVDGVYLGGINTNLTLSRNRQLTIWGANARYISSTNPQASELRDYFKGELDDVRLYRDRLTTADVQALFTASDYTCTNCAGGDALLLYRFEQGSWTSPGDVLDSGSRANHGDALGNVSPVYPVNDISCRALDVPYDDTTATNAVDTLQDVNSIGERGTISFWYKSNTAWNGGGTRQLFDASLVANPNSPDGAIDKFFFFGLDNQGRLLVGMEDTNDDDLLAETDPLSYGANEWVHISLSWDLPGEDVDLYVNGSRVFMYGNVTLSSSTFGALGSIKVGDNSSTYLVNGSTRYSANGQFDDLRVYDYELSREQIRADMADVAVCSSTVHHYEITHPSQALTCSEAQITIKACANAACDQLVSSPVTVNLGAGNWSPSSPVTFTGSQQLTLSQSSAGIAQITAVGADASSQAVSAAVCTQNCEVNFVNAGFEFFDTANPSNLILPDIQAEQSLSRIGIRAVKDNNGVCGALLSGTRSVDLTYDCVDTGAAYSPNQCVVPFAGIGATGDGSGVNSGTVSLTFDANGESSLAGKYYADAGRLNLAVSAQVNNVTIESGTSQFDSVPAQLVVTTSGTSTPHIAGSDFTLSVRAQGVDGSYLPSYSAGRMQGRVTRITPSSGAAADGLVRLGSSAFLTSALSPTYQNITLSGFSNGLYTYPNAYVEEVGEYQLTLRDNNYLGQRINASATVLPRMRPAYFDIAGNSPAFTPACGQFSYVGQTFAYDAGREPILTATAYNALGQVTRNYASTTWTLRPSSTDVSNGLSAVDNSAYSGTLQALNWGGAPLITGDAVYDGQAQLTFGQAQFQYSKIATPTAGSGGGSPFAADMQLTFSAALLNDADGVCYQSAYPGSCDTFSIASIQGSPMRYGRLALENSYGPETESLRMPLVAQYFDAGGWLLNRLDSCTNIDLSDAAGQILLNNASSGSDEFDISGLITASSDGNLLQGISGDEDLRLGPPISGGSALRGSVLLRLDPLAVGASWADFLNYDWNQDGQIDGTDMPSAMASFGLFRGNDRTLHWRERLND